MMKHFKHASLAVALSSILYAASTTSASADWWETDIMNGPSQSDLGGVGLMQMPTGRMAKHGEFSGTYYDNDQFRRMALNLQLFPWLETTIRYNDIRTRLYSSDPDFSGDQTYKDRGVDVKARLLQESYWLPELSVGIRDMAGTGVFAGEFIAASKRLGAFDVTLGVGWGTLGRHDDFSNPFCEISDTFCDRPTGTTGRGGSFEVDKWFRGDAALFGGVEYQTPWEPLRLKVEFDSNDYRNDRSRANIIQDSRWNYGAEYSVSDAFKLKVSYERGNTWMFGFTFRTNFNELGQLKTEREKVAPTNAPKRELEELSNIEKAQELVGTAYQESGFSIQKMEVLDEGKTVRLDGVPVRYRDKDEGMERLGRVLLNELPESVEEYQVVERRTDMAIAQTNINSEKLRTAVLNEDFSTGVSDAFTRENPSLDLLDNNLVYERQTEIGWPTLSVKPFLEQSFGNPENFYMYQLGLNASSSWWLSKNTYVYGVLSGNLFTNYDEFNFLVDSQDSSLPRVRTYIREYVTQSDIWLRNLQINHNQQLTNNWYGSVYGGYLERMYGGVGGEVLYRELDSDWAVGVDANWVKQRSFENHFGFRDYDTVTGHVTGYWKPDFLPNSLVKVAAGRFLAKDDGVQVTFEHKFDSGIIAGAYAAKTNVSSDEYGEGSFTKGFYISIPIDLLQMKHSRSRGAIGWTPLTRDGGQMLHRASQLYYTTDGRSPYYSD